MREILLDGNQMKTKSEMHDHLVERLHLPYYYGRSLDSLWNVLVKDEDPIKITIINAGAIAKGYDEVLLEMFQDLMKSNPNYIIEF